MRKASRKKTTQPSFPSELRFDLVNKDWVVIATGRARRPETFKTEKKATETTSAKTCVFCNDNIKKQEFATLAMVKGEEVMIKQWADLPDDWSLVVIPNKYPAFIPYPKLNKRLEGGLYQKMSAAGFHEVLVTRHHTKQIAQFSLAQVKEVFDAFQKRYLTLMTKRFVNHISLFHNHGPEAGATIAHPHSQIITTPLVDVDLGDALTTAKQYYNKHKECLYCRMMRWEKRAKKRIVFENEQFLVLCPFASKTAFEVIVSPKKHLPYFERIEKEEMAQFAEAFQAAMEKLHKGLNDSPHNFYVHTAPCDGGNYDYYHWHWTILPKTATWAGFEIGTRMEISIVEPEKAAAYLRKQ